MPKVKQAVPGAEQRAALGSGRKLAWGGGDHGATKAGRAACASLNPAHSCGHRAIWASVGSVFQNLPSPQGPTRMQVTGRSNKALMGAWGKSAATAAVAKTPPRQWRSGQAPGGAIRGFLSPKRRHRYPTLTDNSANKRMSVERPSPLPNRATIAIGVKMVRIAVKVKRGAETSKPWSRGKTPR